MDYDSHMGQPKILRLTTCLLPGGPDPKFRSTMQTLFLSASICSRLSLSAL